MTPDNILLPGGVINQAAHARLSPKGFQALLALCVKSAEDDSKTIALHMDAIAEAADTSLSMASQVVKSLRRTGLVTTERKALAPMVYTLHFDFAVKR